MHGQNHIKNETDIGILLMHSAVAQCNCTVMWQYI